MGMTSFSAIARFVFLVLPRVLEDERRKKAKASKMIFHEKFANTRFFLFLQPRNR